MGALKIWDGTQWVYAGAVAQMPFCAVYVNTTTSIPISTWTAVTFDTEIFDDWGMLTPPSTNIVCKQGGVYRISGQYGFSSSTAGSRGARVIKNGSGLPNMRSMVLAADQSFSAPVPSGLVRLALNDIVTLEIWHNAASAISHSSQGDNKTGLSLEWVAP